MSYLLTIKDAAKELGFSRSYVDKQLREGRLKARKIGRNVRIERSEIERWIRTQPARNVVTENGVFATNTATNQNAAPQMIETTTVRNGEKRNNGN